MTIYIVVALIIILILLRIFSEKEIYTEVEINAPAQNVWEVLIALDQYPDWNPFIKEISGDVSEGSQLNVTIYPVDGRPMSFKPTLLKVEASQEMRWIGRLLMPGIFDGEHYFKLLEISEDRVLFIQGENFSGVLVPVFWRSMESGTKKGFQAMNKALKERAELSIQETVR
jgi:hypothetical protein